MVLVVKEVLFWFGKLVCRDKTDGKYSTTKKCVSKNRGRRLEGDLNTCVYNILCLWKILSLKEAWIRVCGNFLYYFCNFL